WTGAFLIIIAAGVLAYGIHDLQEARFLPGLSTLAFDVSGTIDPSSWYATVLKGVFNFTPATTVLQAIAWVSYVAVVMPLYQPRPRTPKRRESPAPAPATTHCPPPPKDTSMKLNALAAGTALALLVPTLAACTSNSSGEGGDDRTIKVTSSD